MVGKKGSKRPSFLFICGAYIQRGHPTQKKNGLKVCLRWKVPSAYPADLQAFLSNNSEIKEIEHNRIKSLAGRRQPGGYLQE